MLLLYANTTVPKRVTVRPSDHSQTSKSGFDLDIAAEAHRWFDYWLKRIDNGIMAEPPIHYYVMGAKSKAGWQSGSAWPPKPRNLLPLYFAPGLVSASETGTLVTEAPTVDEGYDRHTVNYEASTGKSRVGSPSTGPVNTRICAPSAPQLPTYRCVALSVASGQQETYDDARS